MFHCKADEKCSKKNHIFSVMMFWVVTTHTHVDNYKWLGGPFCLHLWCRNKYRLGESEGTVFSYRTVNVCTSTAHTLSLHWWLFHSSFPIGSDRAPASLSCPWLWLINRSGSQQLITPLCLYNPPYTQLYSLIPVRWRQQFPLKCWYPLTWPAITAQKITIWTLIAAKTSKLIRHRTQVEPLRFGALGTTPQLDQRIFWATGGQYVTVSRHLNKLL
jgi:hypothetical protein